MSTTPIAVNNINVEVGAAPRARTSTTVDAQTPPASPPAPNNDAADFRLAIEDDKAAGTYVYKTVDRRTGEVVSQLPRQEIVRLRESMNYVAGAVIKAKA